LRLASVFIQQGSYEIKNISSTFC